MSYLKKGLLFISRLMLFLLSDQRTEKLPCW